MSNNLLQAADLIEAHLKTLNNRTNICACCGVVKYENFGEYQRKKELAAMVRKLRLFSVA